MPDDTDWIVLGDFNFIRGPEDRNKPRGDINDMLLFNHAINRLGLIELPLKGIKFTWSNMQQDPLLEKLDWVFTSASWTISYPSSFVYSMVKPTSDHVPCVMAFESNIPRSPIFRFENYWLHHSSFKSIVQNAWNIPVNYSDSAKKINAKFKNLRRGLKLWAKNLPCLKRTIVQVNEVIDLLDNFEEFKTLSTAEWNLRDILRSHVLELIQNQRIYWKQRGKIKWVKLGNENTKNFHTKATINFRHNHIATLQNAEQVEISNHEGKAAILLKAFKDRMGNSENPNMLFNIEDLYPSKLSCESKNKLEEAFSDKEIDDVIKDLPNDKSPGPDGFNNEFIKGCWEIISEDVKQLIRDFFEGKINLESINSSYITLIPKSDNPSTASDFRPISLLNCVMKIVTKLLANRLQGIILDLVHKN
jgi:hypothetical protein